MAIIFGNLNFDLRYWHYEGRENNIPLSNNGPVGSVVKRLGFLPLPFALAAYRQNIFDP